MMSIELGLRYIRLIIQHGGGYMLYTEYVNKDGLKKARFQASRGEGDWWATNLTIDHSSSGR